MADHLKKYDVVLKTVGPVFVGSGREISKKEYIMFANKIGVLDIRAFMMFLRKKGLTNRFEDFILKDSRSDLKLWLQNNRLSTNDIMPFLRYSLEKGDTVLERRTKTQIMEFVKDPYGLPYVPGSSIKGMLRTILVSKQIMDGKVSDSTVRSFERSLPNPNRQRRNQYLGRDVKRIEAESFNTLNRNDKRLEDAVNDVLSGLIISDSKPLTMDSIILCQKIERHKNGEEKRLNLLRECIRPDEKIEFTLTIDEKICPFTIEDIKEAVDQFYAMYCDCFLEKFKGVGRGRDNTVYLGGGAGFVSKTFVYPMLGDEDGVDAVVEIYRNTNVPREHKHNSDRQLGVSPHIIKMTHFEGQSLQMGECLFEVC